jgi:hypothetical protein
MKTHRLFKPFIAALGLAAFAAAGRAGNDQTTSATSAPAKDAPPAAATPSAPKQADPDAAFARWTDIKECTYDARAQFFAGLAQLETRVDREISSLTARRAAMKSAANTRDWDFAMKEMTDARSALKSLGEGLRKATPDTWAQEKDKVGEAWVRTQEAFAKVKASTTS